MRSITASRRSTGARKGFDGATIGVLWALGVAAEIVLFAFAARLPRGDRPRDADR